MSRWNTAIYAYLRVDSAVAYYNGKWHVCVYSRVRLCMCYNTGVEALWPLQVLILTCFFWIMVSGIPLCMPASWPTGFHGLSCLHFLLRRSARIPSAWYHAGFYVSSGELNSGPCTRMASALPTEWSLQPDPFCVCVCVYPRMCVRVWMYARAHVWWL